ncbi:hypothetical protein [Parageobacillus galactosidasius]|jgi:hypothetical protein|uniref:hypothetical protein n=1 Tax=Parageobacillus galactosidasius TaxID=883812 RepID=UPI001FE9D455|nr:hypothetical protein [Parageobacillus galactosidasius]
MNLLRNTLAFRNIIIIRCLHLKNDKQTYVEYQAELDKIERRAKYIDGLHITYTTIAHYWLIKQLVKASEWRFVTDKDNSLMTSL